MTDPPWIFDRWEDTGDEPFVLPEPPLEVYGKYDPVRGSYYYDGGPFDCNAWRYSFLLEKYGRGEALTKTERNWMRDYKKSQTHADALRDAPVKSKDRRGQLDLFSDLPDEDDAPSENQPATWVAPK